MSQATNATQRYTINIDQDGKRAIDWLAEHTPISRMQLKKALNNGAVWLKQGKKQERMRRATRELPQGCVLELHYNAEVMAQVAQPLTVIDHQKSYTVFFKPAGVLSQGSPEGDHMSALRIAEQQTNRKTYLIHRLDREASGLLIIAHSEKAAALLSQMFQNREIEKRYLVAVKGEWQPELPLVLDSDLDGKHAVTVIEQARFDAGNDQTYLRLAIETGRQHQIRRHLADAGHPVIGDWRYGERLTGESLKLQAFELEYLCPLANRLRRYSVPPELALN